MKSTKEFQKLLTRKNRLQAEAVKLKLRRERLIETVEDLDDDLSSIVQDLTDITEEMLK